MEQTRFRTYNDPVEHGGCSLKICDRTKVILSRGLYYVGWLLELQIRLEVGNRNSSVRCMFVTKTATYVNRPHI
jgi:hypothetical protein